MIVISAIGSTVTMSVAVLLPVVLSPPPETVTELVTVAAAFTATLTVSVISG